MLVTTKNILIKARKNKYAVPAINTQGGNFDIIRSACIAAEDMNSPIILAHYPNTGSYAGHDWFLQVAKWWAEKVSVPVAIHLDHGNDVEFCKRCVDMEFTGIMYDGSSLSVEQNAKNTNEVISYAHKRSIPVEAEIGELSRTDSNIIDVQNGTVSFEDVEKFLSLCNPDSLAIGIGNAHGFYTSKPVIRLDLLKEVASFTDIPLVLHGCTGMDQKIVEEAIQIGISKINFGTQIRFNYLKYLEEEISLEKQGRSFKVMEKASNRLVEDIKNIISLSSSKNRG